MAADGFYMMALDEGEQSFFVGIRSTFYRLATLAGQGGMLIMVDWLLQRHGGEAEQAWTQAFYGVAALFIAVGAYHVWMLPRPQTDTRRDFATRDLMKDIITEDDELITVYYGKDVAEEDAQALTDELADLYDDCDVEMQMGGQPLYYYLISVE